MNFADKVVIITGSSQGIGKALAFELAERGARIVINGRNTERLEEAYREMADKGIDVLAVPGDVTAKLDCQKLVDETIKKYSKIDILVNNAGFAAKGMVSELEVDVFRKVMDINYFGTINPIKAALPHIKHQKGSIILISSLAGLYGLPVYSSYSSSKMALTGLAQSLRLELHDDGVHVGIIHVGFTENDPRKQVYNADGKLEILPKRDNVKLMPQKVVARKIANDISKKKFVTIYTGMGKLMVIVRQIFPGLYDRIMLSMRHKIMAIYRG